MKFRKRGPRLASSFDELMERSYGVGGDRLLRPASSAERLLNHYYGHEPRGNRKKHCEPRCKVHVGCDDANHTLNQQRRNGGTTLAPAPAPMPSAPPPQAKYIPARATAPTPVPAPTPTPAPSVELLPPPVDQNMPMDIAPPPDAPASALPVATQPELPAVDAASPMPAPPAAEPAMASSMLSRHGTSPENTTTSDDDFISDMKSILDGTGAYDKDRKKVIPKSRLRDPADTPAAPYNGVGEGGEGQRIFDRIAKSMKHAGAYDLGDVELENRFADFDRMDELKDRPKKPARKQAKPARRADSAPPLTDAAPRVDNKDFIEDLEAIQKQSVGAAEALRDTSIEIANAMKPKLSNPASVPRGYSRPFYGTGEHARSAGDLYKDQILVGKSPGAVFSYGELVTMGDFFKDVDQLTNEEATKLTELRGLIRREIGGGSVSTEEWMKATRDRYIDLAEENFEHFSPNLFFATRNFPRTKLTRNHKQEWETHHQRAIIAARSSPVDLARIRTVQSAGLPLVINAFGDHFLTDAFAAGHIVNKQEIAELFKDRFYSGGKLSEEGAAFMDKVAKEAWHGKVAAKFEKLETFEPYAAWWNIVDWNPNITDASRFGKILKGVAEKAPDKIANLAVKAIHDHFNLLGIEVVNDAGHAPWKLTGDGHLTEETRKIMETAVRESAAHITDPAVLNAAATPMTEFHARVWKYAPKLTAASANTLTLFVQGYIRPDNPVLVGKAATLINDEVDTLIKQLIDKKALKPA